jgi:hypothetical protein
MSTPTFGFWVCDANTDHTRNDASKVLLNPGPVAVEYPTAPAGVTLETVDGRVVVQQPSKDGRQRQWVWNNLPAWLSSFPTLWTTLERTRSRYRLQAGLSPYVYLLDAETKELSQSTSWSSNQVVRTNEWVRCRVLGITRAVRPGGDVVYSEIRLRFVIDDPAHTYFG